MSGYRIERARADLTSWRAVPETLSPNEGEVVARVDVAALTSNNITYAVHGGAPFHYWNFFPVPDADWGVVPVWGFATVTQSRNADVPEGSRFYGYWPSASHLKLSPGPAKASGFSDTSAHRQGLAPVYNAYVAAGPASPEADALASLFKPLYGTGFVLAHSLSAEAAAGTRILITSASSKTALATAFNLATHGSRPVGLTSKTNLPFVKSTGLYSEVLSYEEIETLAPERSSILVDFSGNGALKARIHTHVTGLKASHIVGDTDWASDNAQPLVGPTPALFFAPSAWEARAREIGPARFEAERSASMDAFLATTPYWLVVQEVHGAEGYADAFARLLANSTDAASGIVWQP
ncbi:MAG: DUF2855 family protein [Sandaracinobacteroides sp.]